MKIIEDVKQISEKVKEKILRVFDKTYLNAPARKTGFIKRSTGKAEGEDFVKLMTAEIIGEEAVSTEGLCDILRQINPIRVKLRINFLIIPEGKFCLSV